MYVRKTEKFDHQSPQYKQLSGFGSTFSGIPDRLYGFAVKELTLVFCGKVFHCLRLEKQTGWISKDVLAYCWTAEQVRDLLFRHVTHDEFRAFMQKRKCPSLWDRTVSFFTAYHPSSLIEWHAATKIPVVLVDKRQVTYNPVLQDIQFFRVLDAFSTFQELSMFISGVLGGQSPLMVEINDKVRLEKHGFDKWSFRRHKDQ